MKKYEMKMYERSIQIARYYLKNDMVNNYNHILDGLIRCAMSDEGVTYLKDVKFKDMVDYKLLKFDA
tara:strand:- start:549 stop:749 length:201 start_codon:yes stop_codon:yes gene_type:complete